MSEEVKYINVTFTRQGTGIGLAYHVGETAALPEEVATQAIDLGFAKAADIVQAGVTSDIPDDMPGRDALIAAGIVTIEELKAVIDTLTEVKGIGQATADKIKERVATL